jgi:N-acetylneuraminic acid mutarotase
MSSTDVQTLMEMGFSQTRAYVNHGYWEDVSLTQNPENESKKKMQNHFDISKKDFFYLHGIYSIQTSVLISSCNFDVEKNSLWGSVFINIQNDVIGLVDICSVMQ